MGGPWEKYQQSSSKASSGPWSKYQGGSPERKKIAEGGDEEIPVWQSRLTGGVSGVLGKFSDELYGVAGAGLDTLSDKVFPDFPEISPSIKDESSNSTRGVVDAYRKRRDEARDFQHRARKAHPMDYDVSEVAGGVGSAFIPGLNATTIPRAMALGGAYALGGSEADLTKGNIEGAAEDVTKGVITGGLLKGAGNVIPKVASATSNMISKVPRELVKKAASLVVPGGGTTVGVADKILRALPKDGTPKVAAEIADTLKDNVMSSDLKNKAIEAASASPEIKEMLKKAMAKGPQYHALLLRLLSKSDSQP